MLSGDRTQAQGLYLLSALSSKSCPFPLSPEAVNPSPDHSTQVRPERAGLSSTPPVLESTTGYLPEKSDQSPILSFLLSLNPFHNSSRDNHLVSVQGLPLFLKGT